MDVINLLYSIFGGNLSFVAAAGVRWSWLRLCQVHFIILPPSPDEAV